MNPEALQALARILESQRTEIRVALFARITRVNDVPNNPTVDCQAVVAESIESLEGARDFEALPEFKDVPVMYLQGAAGFFITFPLQVGGIVHVSIGAQDFSEWFVTGQDSNAHDGRTHALENAVAFPCGFSQGRGPLVTVGAMVVGGTEIRLGLSAAALHVAVAEKVNSELARICTAFDTHTHIAAGMGAPTGTPTVSTPPITLSPSNDVGSTRVKLDS